ncbi:MAG: glycosyltransferase family 2 protein [Alphaproteobacteria bacterium]
MSRRLSALVVARNEEDRLEACLACLDFADERVVVLDRCTDGSASIAHKMADVVLEGEWPIEGDRRNAGLDACSGDWILEVDADESVSAELGQEIRSEIAQADSGYFLIPFLNYIGDRCVRYGWGASWGVSAAPRLSSRGAKRWGRQRIHPALELHGPKRRLSNPIKHQVDRDISDMIRRLDSYTTARAADLRESDNIGSFPNNLRRFFSRFFKCYVARKGYKEGSYGFLIALFAGLFPLISHLKARLESE